MSEDWLASAGADPSMLWLVIASWSGVGTPPPSTEPTLAATEASIGAATFALAATAPLIGAAMPTSPSRSTLTFSRFPSARSPTSVVEPTSPGSAAPAAGAVPASATPAADGSVAPAASAPAVESPAAPWARSLLWSALAVASACTAWSIITPWSDIDWASDPTESTLAPTEPPIGAATLALAATPKSIGAAASMARSRSALRSRIDTTSLSGSAEPPSAASSSSLSPCGSSGIFVLLEGSYLGRYPTAPSCKRHEGGADALLDAEPGPHLGQLWAERSDIGPVAAVMPRATTPGWRPARSAAVGT